MEEKIKIEQILWKSGEIYTIFRYLLLHFHVKTGTRFSLRDERFLRYAKLRLRDSTVHVIVSKIAVLLVGWEFKGQVNNIKVMTSWSVYLTTLFLDRLSS